MLLFYRALRDNTTGKLKIQHWVIDALVANTTADKTLLLVSYALDASNSTGNTAVGRSALQLVQG